MDFVHFVALIGFSILFVGFVGFGDEFCSEDAATFAFHVCRCWM